MSSPDDPGPYTPRHGGGGRSGAPRGLVGFGGLLGVMAGAAVFVALTLLPVTAGIGIVAKKLERRFGCQGTGDIQFPRFPERSTIYAGDGSTLARIFLDENRDIVRLRKVSRFARRAVLAIEDYQFYEHGGVDASAILRAALANLRAGEVRQGGSTITQQLVKNVTGQRQETIKRKIKEACRAIRVERHYTKNEIFELYLNDVFFGHGVYGIETAAQFYFHRHARDLTLPQGALLAGMIAAPGRFDPLTKPRSALSRRNVVLARMAELGWVPDEKAERAQAMPLGLAKGAGTLRKPRNPFWVQFITRQLLDLDNRDFRVLGKTYRERRRALFQGGLRIHTTLNPTWQRLAQDAIRSRLPLPSQPEAAVSTVEVRTGAIRALVSGRDFRRNRQDLVTGMEGRGVRQAGSAFKPFTLVAALRQGVPPGKVYNSKSPIFVPACNRWRVENAEPGTGGYVDLWTATEDSINVVYAQLIRDIGAASVVDAAHDMGITSPLPEVCSLTLGAGSVSPLEMSSAYSTLANDGKHCPPYSVERIISPRGKVLFRHAAAVCPQVLTTDIAHLATAMLQRTVCCGTGTAAYIGRPQAGKTGTHEEYTNAWFVGYVPQYSTAVWVGYPNAQKPMYSVAGFSPVFGGTIPALIWHDYMLGAMQGVPVEDFPPAPPLRPGKVPEVVGLMRPAAEQVLAEANYTPLARFVASSRPKGTVVAQSPRPGSRLVLGAAVTLSVSSGEASGGTRRSPGSTVPGVVGLPEDDAIALLNERGFGVRVVEAGVADKDRHGIVVEQFPPGGSPAEPGSTVTITVGRFEPEKKGKGKGRGGGPGKD